MLFNGVAVKFEDVAKMCLFFMKNEDNLYPPEKGFKGAELFKSTEDAINKAKELCINKNLDEIIIIGGGYLFRDTLSITNKLVLTKVDCNIEGDVFYPDIDLNEWEKLSSEHFTKDSDNDYDFTVITYEKSM